MDSRQLLLYAITDTAREGFSVAEQVELALKGGATIVQLREKVLKGQALEEEALEVQSVCRKYDVPFIINDDVALAVKIGADGVHLGQSDLPADEARKLLGPGKIIGVTAKTPAQAKKAEADGADYLGSGAVFGTTTKLDALPLSMDDFQKVCESTSLPVVAIGGISKDNLPLLKGRKMKGFAVVSAIFSQPDICAAARELRQIAQSLVIE